jgi:hypothetical protein
VNSVLSEVVIKPVAALVDFDGTLSLRGERGPYEWARVSEDLPNLPVIETVRALSHATFSIVVISGRDERCREESLKWIANHLGFEVPLFMRSCSDSRPDFVIKEEIYRARVEPFWNVQLAIDDRQQCVDLWRRLGIVTFQVAEGDF